MGQRFTTSEMQCTVEPGIDQEFYMSLQEMQSKDLRHFITCNEQIHIVLVKQDTQRELTEVLASKSIEWRPVLAAGELSFALEL